jgi:hypothetical protein
MQSGLSAVGSGFQRLGVLAVLLVFGGLFAYAVLVFVIIIIQAAGTFGQLG